MSNDFCVKCDKESSVYCGPCYDKVAKELNDLIRDDDAWRRTYERTHAELLKVTQERDDARNAERAATEAWKRLLGDEAQARAENEELRGSVEHWMKKTTEARVEAESLRLAFAGAETCIELEQKAQQELRDSIGELLVETAAAQREACAEAALQWARSQEEIAADKEMDSAMASAEMHREESIMAKRISAAVRATPLVTEKE